jgi:thymidylate synthase (FAD)
MMDATQLKKIPYPIAKREPVVYPTIQLLDHGEVQLIDFMGDDEAILEAARVSVKNAKQISDKRTLLRYLMRHRHWTPFEMVSIKVRKKMPIFVARQFVRHRTAKINEVSARYGELPEEFYIPEKWNINWQAEKNKQGRSTGGPDPLLAEEMQEAWDGQAMDAFRLYHLLLGKEEVNDRFNAKEMSQISENGGVARELARINLPLSTYTEWVWKCDLRNIFNFLSLRRDPHAQMEIRVYADALGDIVEALCPMAYEAWLDYSFNAITFSAPELLMLQSLVDIGAVNRAIGLPAGGLGGAGMSSREVEEFQQKLRKLLGGA